MGPRGMRMGRGEGSTRKNCVYRSPNIVRAFKCKRLRWAGHVVRMGEDRNTFKIVQCKTTEKRPLDRLSRIW